MMNVNLAAMKALMDKVGRPYRVEVIDLYGELTFMQDSGVRAGEILLAQGVTEEGQTVAVYTPEP